MDEESANKFISALIKSVQTLCHGYVDFSNGVEIIGHINLNIDKGSSFDYILKEKVCRNDENSTLFISNSFHAQPKGEQAFKPNSVQSETHVSHRRHSTDTSESNKLSSVISSISTALSGSHSQTKSRSGSRDNLTNTHQSHPVQSTAKRKAEDDISSDLHPVKSASISRHDSSSGHQHFFTSQSPSHPSGSNSPIDSKASFIPCVGDSSQRTSTSLSDDVHSHVTATMLPQTASITSDNQSDIGVNLEGSVLERIDDRSNSETHDKDDSDLDLEVTFIKEEYVEGDRSACEFQNSSGNQALNRASNQRASSDGVQDPPLYPVALHTNASATYVPSSHEIAAMAHYAAAGAIQQNSMGMPGSSQPQPGPSGLGQSGMRGSVSHHQQPPVQPLQPGVRPGCGYVHPDDAKKWMEDVSGPWRGHTNPKNVAKEDIERLLEEKRSLKEVAQTLNMSRPTLYKLLRKYKLDSAFKYTTNEQIIEIMRGVVAEFPEAARDVEVMLAKLSQRSVFNIGVKRAFYCMKKLNSE